MRLAFIVPRYGRNVVGGAETLCRDFAERLVDAGHEVQVLTTCVRDHMTWRNELRPGTETLGGVAVHRFPVTHPSEYTTMRVLHARMDAGFPLDDRGQRQWVENTGYSTALLEAVAATADRVDALIFLPYLFASTVFGAGLRPERSLIIPCLHNEVYAHFQIIRDTLCSVRGLVFNSDGERDLAVRLLGSPPQHRVVGVGFDEPGPLRPTEWRHLHDLDGDVVAYAGRREMAKNFPLLVQWVTAYSLGLSRRGPISLVAMGSGSMCLPAVARDIVRDVGFQPHTAKLEGLGAAVVTAQLSLNESFSYVVMESWQAGTPVIVHADCEVTRQHCEASGGGLWVRSAEEFAVAVDRLREDARLRAELGAAGRVYVKSRYSWPAVLRRFENAVTELMA